VVNAEYEIGRGEELREDYQQAREWYARVKGGGQRLNAQVRLGKVLARQDNLAAMTEYFSRLRRDHPQNEIVLYLAQADILREEAHHQAAFDLLTQALKKHPNDKDLLYARALAAEKIDRLEVLEEDLRTLLEIDPDNAHALNALGYTLADRTDRYQEALGYLQRAIALLPENAAVLDSMGWVHYRLGNYQKSLDYLRQAYELSADAEIAAHLTEVLWASGHQDEAREIWRKAVEEDPDSPHLQKVRERLGL
jgi:tetratricopeptide (TPR) repeat protein